MDCGSLFTRLQQNHDEIQSGNTGSNVKQDFISFWGEGGMLISNKKVDRFRYTFVTISKKRILTKIDRLQ